MKKILKSEHRKAVGATPGEVIKHMNERNTIGEGHWNQSGGRKLPTTWPMDIDLCPFLHQIPLLLSTIRLSTPSI